jgi:hypothetical protein
MELPYAETPAAWSLLALHHELAHALAADWGFVPATHALAGGLTAGLSDKRFFHGWVGRRKSSRIVSPCSWAGRPTSPS